MLSEWFRRRLKRRELFQFASSIALTAAGADKLAASEGGSPPGGELWVSYFERKNVWGYVGQHSVAPDESFQLMLSTGPKRAEIVGKIEFYRIEPTSVEGGQRLVWVSPTIRVERQPVLRTAATVGAQWPVALEISPREWQPGCYSADFVEDGTAVRDLQVAQMIVRSRQPSGDLLIKLCTNTYQAYNEWGGHSLYPTESDRRGAMVSFDRPGNPTFFEYDVYLVRWLEALARQNGFVVDYVSDFDVHGDPGLLEPYRLVATGAHDEYWSKEEFDAFERRIYAHGRNTIFFGANTAYFQARFADVDRPPDGIDQGRQLVCHKSDTDPIARRKTSLDVQLLVTSRFRDGARRPESMLAGIAYQDWFPAEAGPVSYYAEDTTSEFFEGTGLRPGDAVADVVGYEWDNRDPAGDGKRLWDRERSRNASLQFDRIKVLMSGTADGEKVRQGRAEAVYFESPAGARVFSTGSIRWSWGLGKPGFVRQPFIKFNENLVNSLLRP